MVRTGPTKQGGRGEGAVSGEHRAIISIFNYGGTVLGPAFPGARGTNAVICGLLRPCFSARLGSDTVNGSPCNSGL